MKRLYAVLVMIMTLATTAASAKVVADNAITVGTAQVAVTAANAKTIRVALQQEAGSRSTIRIRNAQNETVYLQPVRNTTFIEFINFRQLEAGTYTLEVVTGKHVSQQQLVIE